MSTAVQLQSHSGTHTHTHLDTPPHAQLQPHHLKDHMVLEAYALLARSPAGVHASAHAGVLTAPLPAVLHFMEHAFVFDGMTPRSDLVWGTWGWSSHRRGQALSSRFADRHHQVSIPLRLFYRMPGATDIHQTMSVQQIQETGLLSLTRLTAVPKRALRERWLDRVDQEWGADRRRAVVDWSVAQLAVEFAGYAQDLLQGPQDLGLSQNVALTMVVHPVRPGRQDRHAPPEPPILIASAWRDPARITRCDAHYLAQAVVV
jgi:hypothetical protein